MNFIEGDLFEYENSNYITMAILNFDNDNYICATLLNENEMPTDLSAIFKVSNETLEIVTDQFLQNLLIPKFQKILQKEVDKILDEVNNEM